MRLLHTSDWHLGRSFHGVDLVAAQAAMVDGLVDVVRSERVDAVLIAGDLYDRALPPVDAVELWGQTLERLTDAGAAVVVISGNHDSARRLGGGARLLERARVHIRTEVARAAEPVMLHDDDGEVAVYAVPYLEPDVVRPLLAPTDAPDAELRTHAASCGLRVDLCRADLAQRARLGMRSVVMAHAFVAGGATSASERELIVGGAGQVPPSAFAGFDYVALGHLHGPQVIGDGSVRYAGSPLAYSFSEERHDKGCLAGRARRPGPAVDRGGADRDAETAGTAARPMPELIDDRRVRRSRGCFVSAMVTDLACPVGAMATLQRRFPHAVELSWQPEGGLLDLGGTYASRVAEADDLEVVPPSSATCATPTRGRRACGSARGPRRSDPPPGRGLMRPHLLEISAFGPFPGKVTVDLDDLARPACCCCTARQAPARPPCSTPSATRSTARCPVTAGCAACAASTPPPRRDLGTADVQRGRSPAAQSGAHPSRSYPSSAATGVTTKKAAVLLEELVPRRRRGSCRPASTRPAEIIEAASSA